MDSSSHGVFCYDRLGDQAWNLAKLCIWSMAPCSREDGGASDGFGLCLVQCLSCSTLCHWQGAVWKAGVQEVIQGSSLGRE